MKHNQVFLKHILDEVNFLKKETKGIKFEQFIKNEILKKACSRSLEIIGEAVKIFLLISRNDIKRSSGRRLLD
jgi:uncharacterized protein with HEPN domain